MLTVAGSEIQIDWLASPTSDCRIELSVVADGVRYVLLAAVPTPGREAAMLEILPNGNQFQLPLAAIEKLLAAVPGLLEWQRRIDASDGG